MTKWNGYSEQIVIAPGLTLLVTKVMTTFVKKRKLAEKIEMIQSSGENIDEWIFNETGNQIYVLLNHRFRNGFVSEPFDSAQADRLNDVTYL
jgi:hypothetical protein